MPSQLALSLNAAKAAKLTLLPFPCYRLPVVACLLFYFLLIICFFGFFFIACKLVCFFVQFTKLSQGIAACSTPSALC